MIVIGLGLSLISLQVCLKNLLLSFRDISKDTGWIRFDVAYIQITSYYIIEQHVMLCKVWQPAHNSK
jgi:hypothetical protein